MNSKEVTKELQRHLKKINLYNGKIDGDPGPLTASALDQYHTKDKADLLWMTYAIGELGISEIYGDRHNPRIIHYHTYTGLGAKADEVAWCASFCNAALIEGAKLPGTRSAAAASFKKYGKEVDPTTYGAILLFETTTGSRRHVCFNSGYFRDRVFALGGNQSNKVNIQPRYLSEVKEARFPTL
jgi:uncharacterized protein (TIGR02594 family)